MQPGRAAGNDGLPADVLHFFPGPLAKLFYPVLLKVAFRLQEPLQFKGGSVRHIYKHKGDIADCSNHRGILISNRIGKGFHSAFRRKCGDWYDATATPLQTGGRRGFPVTLAAQTVRAYQEGHLHHGRSVALIFLDLKEAFHKVARPLVHGGDLCDAHIIKILQAFELPPDHMHLLRSYVRTESILIPAGASPWAASVVREFQEDSWLTVGRGLGVVESGTRPGDSLADIIFSFLFAAVLKRVRQAMLTAGHDVRLPWAESWFRSLHRTGEPDGQLAPIDVSWMDDLALLLSAETPAGLIESVREASATLIDECLKALLYPNLAPGKTEAILSLVGRHSRSVRAEIYRDSEPSLALDSKLWPTARLRLVSRYKHLGGILHCTGSLSAELQARCALAWHSFRKHRRLIFASPIVTHREKSLLFHSLVLSSLLYGAGTWPVQDGPVVDKLQGVLLAMTRQMLRPTYNFDAACHLGARMILAVARVPTAGTLLHVERLRHLAVIVRVAPREFWAVLHHGATWCRIASDSVTWLSSKLERAGKGQPNLSSWAGVLETLLRAPNIWKRWVRSAQQTALLEELWEAEVQHYHGLLFRQLLSQGATADDVIDDSTEVCAICQQHFADLRCWSHHAFKRHGRIKESRLVAQGTQCMVCLRHFATTFRLSNHLEHSKSCLAALMQRGCYVEAVPGRGSRGFKDGRDSQLPAVTASGPHCQWTGNGFIPEPERADSIVLDGLTEIFGQPVNFPDFDIVLRAVRGVFLGVCLQHTRLRATARAWKQLVEEELSQDEDISVRWASWHARIADWLCRVDFAQWLVPSASPEPQSTSTFRDCTLLLPWLSFDSVHLPICCEVLDLGLRVVSAERRLFDGKLHSTTHFLSHEQCIQHPTLLDFGLWISEQPTCVFGFCLTGLIPSLAVPSPIKHYKALAPQLGRLRLFADLVRGVLHLWTHGRPAYLVSTQIDCPGLAAVKKAAPVTSRHRGVEIFSNFQGPVPFTRGFTS